MAGIVTRIGQWIDERWEEKATRREVRQMFMDQENHCIKSSVAIQSKIDEVYIALNAIQFENKELADLKTRIERMEVYSGMTRKVDPSKPPVAKSAFSM